jgi:hypothetical protein
MASADLPSPRAFMRAIRPEGFSDSLQEQVDGARRDLLETVTRAPLKDIVSVYTTFPWPALCAEIAKLKIAFASREGPTSLTFPCDPIGN